MKNLAGKSRRSVVTRSVGAVPLSVVPDVDRNVNAIGITVLRYVASRRAAHEIGKATAYRYRTILVGFGQLVGMDMALVRVHRSHLDRWFAQRDKDGVAKSTLSHEYSVLHSFFTWAVEMELITKSPCAGLKGPARPESRPRSLEITEVSQSLEGCLDARGRAIVTLMVQCGLRCCEVSRLTTMDVSLADKMMRVVGKGDKERYLPIPEEAVAALTDYFGEYAPIAGPVFRSYHHPGRGISPGRIGEIVRIAMQDAGVKKKARDGKSAHALRHTFASDLVELGVDVEDIRQGLGHSSLATTGIYTKKFRAAERLGKVMEGRTYRLGASAPQEAVPDHPLEPFGPPGVPAPIPGV